MDGRLKAKVRAMSMELAREEQTRLRAAGTMIELEELACEIGDEFTSQLLSQEMAARSDGAAESATHACPDCGRCCGQGASKRRKLTGVRGAVHYHEPAFYCPVCRRSFFPGGGEHGPRGSRDGDAQAAPENDLGGGQSQQL
jgi:hypothetical protein